MFNSKIKPFSKSSPSAEPKPISPSQEDPLNSTKTNKFFKDKKDLSKIKVLSKGSKISNPHIIHKNISKSTRKIKSMLISCASMDTKVKNPQKLISM